MKTPIKHQQHIEMKPGTTPYKMRHRTIGQMFGKPSLCEECGKDEGRFEWANLSGEFNLERGDWKRLCVPCHRKLDRLSYEGNRFDGHKHSEVSKQQTAESMRKYWAENREKMMAVQPRGKRSGRYKHGRYSRFES